MTVSTTAHAAFQVVLNSAFAERLLQPRIEATWMNTEHSVHRTDIELRTMHFDKCVLHFASLTRYTVALFRMSRSSVTRASSRFNRLISVD